ncbi:MAG TPA: DUF3179 domain-containing protein [Anaerolineae bacterium]|nr:DUF3179 domain-containing protein [Anaerolineae bacterium]
MKNVRFTRLFIALITLAVIAAACTSAASPSTSEESAAQPTAVPDEPKPAEPTTAPAATAVPEEPADTPEPEPADTAVPEEAAEDEPAEEPLPRGVEREFSTDFSRTAISFSEILSGGPPKDGIPAIDDPKFVTVEEADEWLGDKEPVIVLQEGDVVRAYPYQILIWHEIVNDVIDGRPVAVTFCPLCNTGIVFDATVNGQALDFGTTGRLRYSSLLMYDRQTETWWQQAGGNAVIGELLGEQLDFLPAVVLGWSEVKETYPDAEVLSKDTGIPRDYGRNPYAGYDDINSSPFLFDGPPTPGQLPPMARIVTVDLNDEAVAYPNDILQDVKVVNDTVGGTDVVVFWESGVASALGDSDIASGEDVGTTAVYERTLDGETLTFTTDGETITDEQTGSAWNILGQAVDGELEGTQLTPVVKVDHFWFSWAAFRPDTRIYQPES